MFDSLTEKLGQALRNLRGVGKLTEENMADALKEVRSALLSADVHFKVVREFIERVQTACVGQEVLKGVAPGQQIVKIINDELVRLLGEGATALSAARPLKVLLVGLHGSGKTTSSATSANPLSFLLGVTEEAVPDDCWADPVGDAIRAFIKNPNP